jgi:hypothetical protein
MQKRRYLKINWTLSLVFFFFFFNLKNFDFFNDFYLIFTSTGHFSFQSRLLIFWSKKSFNYFSAILTNSVGQPESNFRTFFFWLIWELVFFLNLRFLLFSFFFFLFPDLKFLKKCSNTYFFKTFKIFSIWKI